MRVLGLVLVGAALSGCLHPLANMEKGIEGSLPQGEVAASSRALLEECDIWGVESFSHLGLQLLSDGCCHPK